MMELSWIFFLDKNQFFVSFRHLMEVRCLFLQHNKLDKIENISLLQNLTTLNLSHNYLSSLCSLACLPNLHTFIVSYNKLCTSKVQEFRVQRWLPNLLIFSHFRFDSKLYFVAKVSKILGFTPYGPKVILDFVFL